MRLNSIQAQMAKIHEGPVCVSAVAGSGKSTGIICNLNHAYAEAGIPPGEIMVTTFSKDAAKNLKTKLEAIYGPLLNDAPIGTSHSLFLRMLLEQGVVERNVIPELAAKITIRKAIGSAYKQGDEIDYLKIISFLKNSLAYYKPIPGTDVFDTYQDLVEVVLEPYGINSTRFHAVFEAYEADKEARSALDKDDMLFKAYCMLQTQPDTLALYQERYPRLIIDEYQDTNEAQYRLYRLMAQASRNIMVVGDDDQAIYAFRGSHPIYIQRFLEDYPDATHLTLAENYRSQSGVASAANALIAHNLVRIPKSIQPTKPFSMAPVHLFCQDERTEARFIAESVRRSPYPLDEIAVLTRLNAQQCWIEDAFNDAAIPYYILESTPFYARKEIQALIAYLHVIQGQGANISMIQEIANKPYRRISNEEANAWSQFSDLKNTTFGLRLHDDLKMLMDLYRKHDDLAMVLDKIINAPVWLSSWARSMSSVNEEPQALQNMEHFQELAHGEKIHTMLEKVGRITEGYKRQRRTSGRVAISTIHRAKGLEWEEVYIPGVVQGKIPHRSNPNQEEERRLMYVAITRGKNVVISTSKATETPSQFLMEMGNTINYDTMVPVEHVHPDFWPLLEVKQENNNHAI